MVSSGRKWRKVEQNGERAILEEGDSYAERRIQS